MQSHTLLYQEKTFSSIKIYELSDYFKSKNEISFQLMQPVNIGTINIAVQEDPLPFIEGTVTALEYDAVRIHARKSIDKQFVSLLQGGPSNIWNLNRL